MKILRLLLPLTFTSLLSAISTERVDKFKGKLVVQGAKWVSRKAQVAGLTVEQRSAKIISVKVALQTSKPTIKAQNFDKAKVTTNK
ncbi:MAG: hypothetical protein Q8Q60_02400 [Candidatus Chromulinivorax sp.]|nr:hypothetical protein [Candidatus Chromulinivorax sp.]